MRERRNAPAGGGSPESVSSRSTAEKRISSIIGDCRSVTQYTGLGKAVSEKAVASEGGF